MATKKKQWKLPKVKEVRVEEDGTSMNCQGKAVGCYTGSSCGSVKKDNPTPRQEPKR